MSYCYITNSSVPSFFLINLFESVLVLLIFSISHLLLYHFFPLVSSVSQSPILILSRSILLLNFALFFHIFLASYTVMFLKRSSDDHKPPLIY